MRWPAPAKINLFLHILGQREDGYHLLQTAFQFLDYSDEIEIMPRSDGQIQCLHRIPGISEQDDIIYQAAKLLQSTLAVSAGVDIKLHKRLPMGGGLGGGSSDAATVLVALNRLWQCEVTTSELEEIALKLGADVPVFVRGEACWAEGVGEQLTPIDLPEPWYLVLIPPVSIPTAEIFSSPELTRNSQPITIRDLKAGKIRNDCEAVVTDKYPQVGKALDSLSYFTEARMTGTGACVFGQFETQAFAEQALQELSQDNSLGLQGFVAKGINRSPVLDCLESIAVKEI